MGLVITGHMLPAGGIAAQEPAVPTLSVPATPQSEAAAAPSRRGPLLLSLPRLLYLPHPKPQQLKPPRRQSIPRRPPKLQQLPSRARLCPSRLSSRWGPEPLNTDERVYRFDDWTVTIRPAPKNVVRIPRSHSLLSRPGFLCSGAGPRPGQ